MFRGARYGMKTGETIQHLLRLPPHVIVGLNAVHGPAALQHGAGQDARSGTCIRHSGILPAGFPRQKLNNGGGITGPALNVGSGFSGKSVSIIHRLCGMVYSFSPVFPASMLFPEREKPPHRGISGKKHKGRFLRPVPLKAAGGRYFPPGPSSSRRRAGCSPH